MTSTTPQTASKIGDPESRGEAAHRAVGGEEKEEADADHEVGDDDGDRDDRFEYPTARKPVPGENVAEGNPCEQPQPDGQRGGEQGELEGRAESRVARGEGDSAPPRVEEQRDDR